MNILCIGDIVAEVGVNYLQSILPKIKQEEEIDIVIANGENSANGNGVLPYSANRLFECGVNIITGGNHTFKRREIYDYLDENNYILRPLNISNCQFGRGYIIYDLGKVKICVINLLGRGYMNNFVDCPFKTIEDLLQNQEINECKVKIVDFHAETTSEKLAMGYFLKDKVSCVFGTHTHVQTSDETILGNKTAYITDIGMTGPINSILGVDADIIINSYLSGMPNRFIIPDNQCKLEGIIIKIDISNGYCNNIKRIRV